MTSRSIEIQFAGHALVLDAAGALYWPAERILVVSDLHLEKSTYLAQHGSLVAPYDTHDILERLNALITVYQPRELFLLGDSFHDYQAWARLEAPLRQRIHEITHRVEHCRWIEGNHDDGMTHDLSSFVAHHQRHNILFAHEHNPKALPQIIGHYHPKMHIVMRGRAVRGKCFVHTDNLIVMPAFGTYTGGLDIRHEAFQTLTKGAASHYYLMYKATIHQFNKANT